LGQVHELIKNLAVRLMNGLLLYLDIAPLFLPSILLDYVALKQAIVLFSTLKPVFKRNNKVSAVNWKMIS
jgi:hypothetical protein